METMSNFTLARYKPLAPVHEGSSLAPHPDLKENNWKHAFSEITITISTKRFSPLNLKSWSLHSGAKLGWVVKGIKLLTRPDHAGEQEGR